MSLASIKASHTRKINTTALEKIDTKAIEGKELTINNFEIMKDDKHPDKFFACVTFAELPKNYYYSGLVLSGILSDIEKDEEAMKEVKEGKLKVKLTTVKSRNGMDYTNVIMV